jgi:hypothetical protein
LFGSMNMDPATRNRIVIPIGTRRGSTSSAAGSDSGVESPTGSSKGSPAMTIRGKGMGTPTMIRGRASTMRESPVASGNLGLPIGQSVVPPNAGTSSEQAAAAVSTNPADAVAGTAVVPPNAIAGQKASDRANPIRPPVSALARDSPNNSANEAPRKVRFTGVPPPPVAAAAPAPAVAPPAQVSKVSAAQAQQNLGLSDFLKQYRSDLEQQWYVFFSAHSSCRLRSNRRV